MAHSPSQCTPRVSSWRYCGSHLCRVALRHTLLWRMKSGEVICTYHAAEQHAGHCEGLFSRARTWELEDEEETTLIVLALRGRCFTVVTFDDGESLLHSSLKANAQVSNSGIDDHHFIGVSQIFGNNAVALWAISTVEIVSHRSVWGPPIALRSH